MLQNLGYKLSKRGLSTKMLERSHEENFGFGHWWLLETEDISKACLLLFPFCEIPEQVANNGLLLGFFFFYVELMTPSVSHIWKNQNVHSVPEQMYCVQVGVG